MLSGAKFKLENWKDSKGACLEYDYALAANKQIIISETYSEDLSSVD